jgi:hypothetical protein
LDEKIGGMEEAAKAGAEPPLADPDACPEADTCAEEAKLKPTLDPPNCELVRKPAPPPTAEEYPGGSPGGGWGLTNTNGFEVAADEAKGLAGMGDGNENGLVRAAGDVMESPARGDGTSTTVFFPGRITVKVTPSLNTWEEPS